MIKNQFSFFFLDFGQKNSTVLSKLPCGISEPLYEEWYNSGTKIFFLQLLGFLKRKISNCGQKISSGLWKLHATWAEKSSDPKQFFLKGCHFLKLNSEIVPKLFELSVSLLSGNSVETAFFVSMPMLKIYIHFLTKFSRFILFFECGQKMFVLLSNKFPQGGQNYVPLVQTSLRGSDVFDRNLSSYHFWSLSGKYFDVRQIFVF